MSKKIKKTQMTSKFILISITLFIMLVSINILSAPQWWSNQGVIDSGYDISDTSDDYSAANLGQILKLAHGAYLEMESAWAPIGGAGEEISDLVSTFSYISTEELQAAINVGQLKGIAKPFYDRLIELGRTDSYLWPNNRYAANAIANIGQAKHVFNFEIPILGVGESDVDGDGLPDEWEIANNSNPLYSNNLWHTAGGLTYELAYRKATSIDEVDSDGDAIPDSWEVAHCMDPNDGNDADIDSDGDGELNIDEYHNVTHPNQYLSSIQDITIAGDFNGWNTYSIPMTCIADYTWVEYLELDAGTIFFKCVGNASWDSGIEWAAENTSQYSVGTDIQVDTPAGNNIEVNIPANGTYRFLLKEDTETISITLVTEIPENEGPLCPVYRVAGNFNDWNTLSYDNIMQENADGKYELMLVLEPPAEDFHEFKFFEGTTCLKAWGETDQSQNIPDFSGVSEFGGTATNIQIDIDKTKYCQIVFDPETGNYSVTDNDTDADGDGLTDGLEIHYYKSDTHDADGDNDGMDDAWEIEHFGNLTEEPYADPDSDNLPNYFEFILARDPNISTPYTYQFIVSDETYGNIQAAIDAAVASEDQDPNQDAHIFVKVLPRTGGYLGEGNYNINTGPYTLLLVAEGDVTIDCDHLGRAFEISEAKACIMGFTIQNGYVEEPGGAIYIDENREAAVLNCIIQDCESYELDVGQGWTGGGGIFSDGKLTVQNTVIQNCESSTRGGGISASESSQELTVRNCTIINNISSGIGGSGIHITHYDPWYNNYELPFRLQNTILNGNISLLHGSDAQLTANRSSYITHNCFDEGIVYPIYYNNDPFDNTLNYTFDPEFETDSWRLTPESPCIDKGEQNYSTTRDIDNETRGNNPDIGADEYKDSDGDNLPDWWEWLIINDDPYDVIRMLEDVIAIDPNGSPNINSDYDDDGLENIYEYEAGANPTLIDTDGGGSSDSFEVEKGLDPIDPIDDYDYNITLSGTIIYDGLQQGVLWIVAYPLDVSKDVRFSTILSEVGNYSITDYASDNHYYIKAWIDTDGNEICDVWEAQGITEANYLIINDLANINITLADPDPDRDGIPMWWELKYGYNHEIEMLNANELWYQFDELFESVVIDSSIWLNHAVFQGGNSESFQFGVFGNALTFDGIDDSVILENESHDSFINGKESERSISFWVKTESMVGTKVLFDLGNDQNGAAIRLKDGLLEFSISSSGVQTTLSVNYPGLMKWHHVVAVYFENNMQLYIDGLLLDETDQAPDSFIIDNDDAVVARRENYDAFGDNDSLGSYFSGILDDILFYYKTPLDQKQVDLLFENGRDVDNDGLSVFEEYKANTLPDIADSDNDGALDGIEIIGGYDPNDPESYPAFLISGEVIYSGMQTGNVLINVSPIDTELSLFWKILLIEPNNYIITEILANKEHQVKAFIDSNSNDELDFWEANGEIQLFLNNDIFGVNINMQDPDSDVDEVADWWEIKYFGGIFINPSDDYDKDGLSNGDEYINGTDPTNPDSDADGWLDGKENDVVTNPLLDSSYPVDLFGVVFYEGLESAVRVILTTSQDSWASENSVELSVSGIYYISGLSINNNYWLKAWLDEDCNGVVDVGEPITEYIHNPIILNNTLTRIDLAIPDEDGDGLSTDWEILNNINPTDYGNMDINNGSEGDPDGDGYINYVEQNIGMNPLQGWLIDNNDTITLKIYKELE